MRQYLMLATEEAALQLLTVDMLTSWKLCYRGDLVLRGPSARDRGALPRERNLLCIDTDTGGIYRPEGDGTTTALGNAIEHLISRPVLNAVYHGDSVPLLFTTQQETNLRRAMQRAEIGEDDYRRALAGEAVRLCQPQLARLICEALRIVTDYTYDRQAGTSVMVQTFKGILTTVKVDRAQHPVTA